MSQVWMLVAPMVRSKLLSGKDARIQVCLGVFTRWIQDDNEKTEGKAKNRASCNLNYKRKGPYYCSWAMQGLSWHFTWLGPLLKGWRRGILPVWSWTLLLDKYLKREMLLVSSCGSSKYWKLDSIHWWWPINDNYHFARAMVVKHHQTCKNFKCPFAFYLFNFITTRVYY